MPQNNGFQLALDQLDAREQTLVQQLKDVRTAKRALTAALAHMPQTKRTRLGGSQAPARPHTPPQQPTPAVPDSAVGSGSNGASPTSGPAPRTISIRPIAADILTKGLTNGQTIPETLEEAVACAYGENWSDREVTVVRGGRQGVERVRLGDELASSNSQTRSSLRNAVNRVFQLQHGTLGATPSRALQNAAAAFNRRSPAEVAEALQRWGID